MPSAESPEMNTSRAWASSESARLPTRWNTSTAGVGVGEGGAGEGVRGPEEDTKRGQGARPRRFVAGGGSGKKLTFEDALAGLLGDQDGAEWRRHELHPVVMRWA